jgi:hypothetical protein
MTDGQKGNGCTNAHRRIMRNYIIVALIGTSTWITAVEAQTPQAVVDSIYESALSLFFDSYLATGSSVKDAESFLRAHGFEFTLTLPLYFSARHSSGTTVLGYGASADSGLVTVFVKFPLRMQTASHAQLRATGIRAVTARIGPPSNSADAGAEWSRRSLGETIRLVTAVLPTADSSLVQLSRTLEDTDDQPFSYVSINTQRWFVLDANHVGRLAIDSTQVQAPSGGRIRAWTRLDFSRSTRDEQGAYYYVEHIEADCSQHRIKRLRLQMTRGRIRFLRRAKPIGSIPFQRVYVSGYWLPFALRTR